MKLLEGYKREREIKKVLWGLARQQVCDFDAAHNAWIVKRRVPNDNNALLTCRARGWAEPMSVGAMDSGVDPTADRPQERFTLYRLTDSGWKAVQRTHDWIVRTFIVAALTLVATVVGIVIAVWISQS